jgi:hypothetical protein
LLEEACFCLEGDLVTFGYAECAEGQMLCHSEGVSPKNLLRDEGKILRLRLRMTGRGGSGQQGMGSREGGNP